MKISSFLFICLCFLPVNRCEGQLSSRLFKALPDSLKPAKPSDLKPYDAERIISTIFDLGQIDHRLLVETDSLCLKFAGSYGQILSEVDRKRFLFQVCRYFYRRKYYTPEQREFNLTDERHRYPFAETLLHYCGLYRRLFPDDQTIETASILMYLSVAYQEMNNFKLAYNALQDGLALAKRLKNKLMVVRLYASLGTLFESLDVAQKTLIYYDSVCLVQLNKRLLTREQYQKNASGSFYPMFTRNFFENNARNIRGISVAGKNIKLGVTGQRFLAYSYILLSGLSYYKGEYSSSLAYIDSASHTFSNFRVIDGWELATVFRILSLRKLNRFEESNELLKTVDLNDFHRPVLRLLMEEMYLEEKEKGNYQKAVLIQERLFQFEENRHLLNLQGKALEMEQVYKLLKREEQINDLMRSQRRNLIVFVCVILLAAAVTSFLLVRYNASLVNTSQLLNQLDEATNSQVLYLEAARGEERKLLGQELHDNLSSLTAGIRHRLELLRLRFEEGADKKELGVVNEEMTRLYDILRAKSHFLYRGSADFAVQHFSTQVHALVDSVFPDGHYSKEVRIDNDALELISLEDRIGLIHIIREALTNVIKHAKATAVSVTLTRDETEISLRVKDNGKGFHQTEAKYSLGLKSMRERLQKMDGVLNVSSSENGTSITATFAI